MAGMSRGKMLLQMMQGENPAKPGQTSDGSDSARSVERPVPTVNLSRAHESPKVNGSEREQQMHAPSQSSEKKDALLETWNPMLEDYLSPEFNSYNSGPGRALPPHRQRPLIKGEQRPQDNIELYVSGIPMELTEEGLSNLFSRAGKVLRAVKMKPKTITANDTTYGFIRFASVAEAEAAIRLLDNKILQNVMLRVRIAMTKEEKEKRWRERELAKQMKLKEEEEEDVEDVPAVKGSGEDTSTEASDGDLVHPSSQGATAGSVRPIPANANNLSESSRDLLAGKMTNSVGTQRSTVAMAASPASIRSKGKTNQPQVKREPGPCVHCFKPGNKNCSKCKTIYCSRECQVNDWPRHKHFCGKPVDAFEKQFDIDIGDETIGKVTEVILGTKDVPLVRGEKTSGNTSCHEQEDSESGVDYQQMTPHEIHQGVMRPPRQTPRTCAKKAIMAADLRHETLSSDSTTRVILINLTSLSEFTLIKFDNFQRLLTLQDSIQQVIEELPAGGTWKDYSPVVGEICIARFAEDKKWYRARIDNIKGINDNVAVTYLDFGNSGDIPAADVIPLPTELAQFPLQGIQCRLAGVRPMGTEWSNEDLPAIAKIMPMEEYEAELVSQQDRALVRLTDPISHQDISKKILEANLARKELEPRALSPAQVLTPSQHTDTDVGYQSMSEQRGERHPSNQQYSTVIPQPRFYDRLEPGIQVKVKVTELLNPTDFWVQVQKDEGNKEFVEMQEKIMTYYQRKKRKHGFRCPGHKMLAVEVRPGEWSRAEVLSYDTIDVTVRLVDIGSILHIGFSSVLPLEGQHITLPYLAMHCSISGAEPLVGTTWSAKATKFMRDYTMDHVLEARVVKLTEAHAVLDIQDPHQELSLGDALISGGHGRGHSSASRPTEKQQPQKMSVIMADSLGKDTLAKQGANNIVIVDTSSPSEVTVQRIDSALETVKLGESLNCALATYTGRYLPTVEGELVYTKYTDSAWYRAKVLHIRGDQDTVDVEFIDYGNRESVSCTNICQIDASVPQPKIYGIQCLLHGLQDAVPVCDWTTFADKSFVNKQFYAEVKQFNQKDEIILYDSETGDNVNQMLIEKEVVKVAEAHGVVGIQDLHQNPPSGGVVASGQTKQHGSPSGPSKNQQTQRTSVIMADNLEKDTLTEQGEEVIVVDTSSPREVTVQKMASLQEAAKLGENLNCSLATYTGHYLPTAEGELVYTKYYKDSAWYRTKVLHIRGDQDTVDVEFIDYGNRESVSCTNICQIDASVPQPKIYGIQCLLHGLQEAVPVCDWTTFADESFVNKPFYAEVKQFNQKDEIILYDSQTGDNVNQMLIEKEVVKVAEAHGVVGIQDLHQNPPSGGVVASGQTKQHGSPSGPSKNQQTQRTSVIMADNLEKDTLTEQGEEVIVVDTSSPREVTVQKMASLLEAAKLGENLNCTLATYTGRYLPTVEGELVYTKYHRDSAWYRAKVLHIRGDQDTVDVEFIDYGNRESVSCTNICQIDTSVPQPKIYGIQCLLLGLQDAVPVCDWTSFATKSFVNKQFYAEVKQKCNQKDEIILYDPGTGDDIKKILVEGKIVKVAEENATIEAGVVQELSPGGTLVATGQAQQQYSPSGPSKNQQALCTSVIMADRLEKDALREHGEKTGVLVVDTPSPREVTVQRINSLFEAVELKDRLNNQLATYIGRYLPTVEGELVYTKYTDGEWYRAKVLHIRGDQDTVDVEFIDYGNRDSVSCTNICQIDASVPQPKIYGIQCSLHGLQDAVPVRDWSKYAREFLVEKKFYAEVKRKSNFKHEIILYNSNTYDNVNKFLLEEKVVEVGKVHGLGVQNPPSGGVVASAQTQQQSLPSGPSKNQQTQRTSVIMADSLEKDTLTEQGANNRVIVVDTSSPREVTVQTIDSLLEAAKLGENLNCALATYTGPYLPVAEGELVYTKYHKDSAWYRAKVLHIRGDQDTVDVEFIDYGNRESVSCTNICQIDASVPQPKIYGIQCLLHGLQDAVPVCDWTTFADKSFVNKQFYAEVKQFNQKDEIILYDSQTGDNVNQMLIEKEVVKVAEAHGVVGIQDLHQNPPSGGVVASGQTKQHGSPSGPSKNQQTQRTSVIMADSLEKDTLTEQGEEVIVVDTSSPREVTVQKMASLQEAAELGENLNCSLATYTGHYLPTAEGELVYTKYYKDSAWYRAKVLHIRGDQDTVDVEFIDYGNRESVSCTNICQIDASVPQPKIYGIQCSLHGLQDMEPSLDWSDFAAKYLVAKPYHADIKGKCARKYEIVLYDTETKENINETLVETELVLPIRPECSNQGTSDLQRTDLTDHLAKAALTGRIVETSSMRPLEKSDPRDFSSAAKSYEDRPIAQQSDSHSQSQLEAAVPRKPSGKGAVSPGITPGVEDLTLPFPEPQRFQEGIKPDVHIWHFEHAENFYCQWLDPVLLQQYHANSQLLQETYSQAPSIPYRFSVGNLVAAQSKDDGVWYRAVIRSILPDFRAEVQFVDFGNSETVGEESMRQLERRFWEQAFQAIPCRLVGWGPPGEEWSPIATSFLRDILLNNQVLTLTVCGYDNNMYNIEDITDDAGNSVLGELADTLEKGFPAEMLSSVKTAHVEVPVMSPAPVRTSTPPVNQASRPVFKMSGLPALSLKSTFDGQVSEVETPDSFYMQEHDDEIEQLSQIVAVHCEQTLYNPNFQPEVGELCCVQFSDGLWYRACIDAVDWNSKVLNVTFIDFGNKDVVEQNKLRPFIQDLATFPAKAFQCALSGVWPCGVDWSSSAVEGFKNLVNNKVVKVTLGVKLSGMEQVTITNSRGQNLSAALVKKGLASAIPPTEALRQDNARMRQELEEMKQMLQQVLKR